MTRTGVRGCCLSFSGKAHLVKISGYDICSPNLTGLQGLVKFHA
jgi:hypothetical protein